MLLHKPLVPQKTEAGYRVEIKFLDAAPPNQLIGLNEKSFRTHLLHALESVLQKLLEEQGMRRPWQDVMRISEFSINWDTANPNLYATDVEFSFSRDAESQLRAEICVRSKDRRFKYAKACAMIESYSGMGNASDQRPTLDELIAASCVRSLV